MAGSGESGRLTDAFDRALRAVVASAPTTVIRELPPGAPDGASALSDAGARATPGSPVFLHGPLAALAGAGYGIVRTEIAPRRANVKIVTRDGGVADRPIERGVALLEDIGVMRGIPGMTVVVPCDAPTTEAATAVLAERDGPAYLRLCAGEHPTVTNGAFRLGIAEELRPGSDLAVVAIGGMVARGLRLAEEFRQVGVSVRVLDLASVKPFDEAAVLRAARDTGALLTAEEHGLPTGIGTLVAAVTAENYPVPVRRVGVPDLFDGPATGDPYERLGLGLDRLRDEAWELLRQRGKVQ